MSAAMDCRRARDLIAMVPGSELPAAQDAAVRAHLASCNDCRHELGAYLSARRALLSLSPSSDVADAEFFAKLRSDTLAAVRAATAHRGRRHFTVPGLLVAAALFLVGVFLASRVFEPSEFWKTTGPIDSPPRAHTASDPRFQEVGYYYGLLGRQRLNHYPPSRVLVPGEIIWPQAGTLLDLDGTARRTETGAGGYAGRSGLKDR